MSQIFSDTLEIRIRSKMSLSWKPKSEKIHIVPKYKYKLIEVLREVEVLFKSLGVKRYYYPSIQST